MKKISELLDKRVLFRVTGHSRVRGGVAIELSPSGKYVCMGDEWLPAEDVTVVEVLEEEIEEPFYGRQRRPFEFAEQQQAQEPAKEPAPLAKSEPEFKDGEGQALPPAN